MNPRIRALFKIAETQDGYFTTSQAKKVGVSAMYLYHAVKRENFQHPLRGVYRFTLYPHTQNEELTKYFVWSGGKGVFCGPTASQLHGLTDALPAKIHMAYDGVSPDDLLELYPPLPAEDAMWLGPIRVQTRASLGYA